MMKCTHPDCEIKVLAKQLCQRHYQKQLRIRNRKFTEILNSFAMDKEIRAFGKLHGLNTLTRIVKATNLNYFKIKYQLGGQLKCRLETMQELVKQINPDYEVVIINNKPKINLK